MTFQEAFDLRETLSEEYRDSLSVRDEKCKFLIMPKLQSDRESCFKYISILFSISGYADEDFDKICTEHSSNSEYVLMGVIILGHQRFTTEIFNRHINE